MADIINPKRRKRLIPFPLRMLMYFLIYYVFTFIAMFQMTGLPARNADGVLGATLRDNPFVEPAGGVNMYTGDTKVYTVFKPLNMAWLMASENRRGAVPEAQMAQAEGEAASGEGRGGGESGGRRGRRGGTTAEDSGTTGTDSSAATQDNAGEETTGTESAARGRSGRSREGGQWNGGPGMDGGTTEPGGMRGERRERGARDGGGRPGGERTRTGTPSEPSETTASANAESSSQAE